MVLISDFLLQAKLKVTSMNFLKKIGMVFCIFGSIATFPALAGDRLNAGETMSNDQYIQSPNGQYTLIMQSDGSLVMYRADGTVRYRMAKHGTHATMQADGNFVEFKDGREIWSSDTHQSGTWLQIYDSGDLRVEWYNSSMGYVAWSIGVEAGSNNSNAQVYPPVNTPPPGTPPVSIPQRNFPAWLPAN